MNNIYVFSHTVVNIWLNCFSSLSKLKGLFLTPVPQCLHVCLSVCVHVILQCLSHIQITREKRADHWTVRVVIYFDQVYFFTGHNLLVLRQFSIFIRKFIRSNPDAKSPVVLLTENATGTRYELSYFVLRHSLFFIQKWLNIRDKLTS